MKYFFKNRKLEQLYETGKSNKYRLDKTIVHDFFWLVDYINASRDIYDFWNQPSLNFEKMESTADRYSFRLSKKFRLEVKIEWENEEQTIGIIGIDEISNHYH